MEGTAPATGIWVQTLALPWPAWVPTLPVAVSIGQVQVASCTPLTTAPNVHERFQHCANLVPAGHRLNGAAALLQGGVVPACGMSACAA